MQVSSLGISTSHVTSVHVDIDINIHAESAAFAALRTRRLSNAASMLFFSFFKTLESKSVTIELKNDLRIKGILHSVDQYLNCKLQHVQVLNAEKHPQLITVSSVFIRGSVVRYVHINPADVDVALLQDATRREYRQGRNAP